MECIKVIMRGNDTAVEFIGRMLYRSKLINIHFLRKYDDTARMLSGRSLNADQSCRTAVELGIRHRLPLGITDVLYKRNGILIRKAADRTGAEGMVLSEKLFYILMGARLIFAGEVQVDIRLFVSVETEEGLKRDILSVGKHHGAALRTWFDRKVVT